MAGKHKGKGRLKRIIKAFLTRLLVFLIIALSVSALIVVLYRYTHQETGIGDEQLELCLVGDKMNISWDETEDVDFIRIYRVVNAQTNEETVVGEYTEPKAVMDNIVSGEELTLKFEPVTKRSVFGYEYETRGSRKVVTIVPLELTVPNLQKDINVDNKAVTLEWLMDSGCVCELYNDGISDECRMMSSEDTSVTLTVGEELAMPERGEPIRLLARTYKQEKNCKQYSVYGEILEIAREELLPNEVDLALGIGLDGKYSFSWKEARQDTYEFMQYDEELKQWESLKVYSVYDDFAYQIDWLPSETIQKYKLLAYFKNPKDSSEEGRIESAELKVRTSRSPQYCTIWPIMDMDVYASADSDEVIGKVKGGETLCVLEENNGRFRVRCDAGYGYVDERYMMINLPHYLGDLCIYDISNSYSSIFKVQDYSIPGLTDTVIPGFEDISLNPNKGEFVVPYLYPCAVRLAQAAENVSADNYILKIYEAYRPHKATRYMYDTTEQLLNCQVPLIDEEGNEVGVPDKENEEEYTSYVEQLNMMIAEQVMAEGYDITTDEGMLRMQQLYPIVKLQYQIQDELMFEEIDPLSEQGALRVSEILSGQPTYEAAMTGNGSMRLSAFLAKTVSAHNRGIALDLTIQDRDSNSELGMQSPMHDLSYRSVIAANNENAELLKKYMMDVGFNNLSSEWWHFQDDETRNAINLGVYLEDGVSLEGWKNNNVGWRYQKSNGEFYKNTTEVIDGVRYSFDEKGYTEDFE